MTDLSNNPFVRTRILIIKPKMPGFTGSVNDTVLSKMLEAISNNNEDETKQVVHVSQDRIDKSALKKMSKLRSSILMHIKKNSIKIKGTNITLVPFDRVNGINNFLEGKKEEWFASAKEFVNDYPNLVEDFKVKCPMIYDREKYPSQSKVAGMFNFTWQWLKFDVPNRETSEVNEEEVERERQRFMDELKAMELAVVSVVASEIKNKLQTTITQYDKKGDVSSRVFNGVANFLKKSYDGIYSGFLFSEELKKLVEEDLKPFMNGVDREGIKDNPVYQAELINKAEEIKEGLDTVIEKSEKPSYRMMDF